MELYLNECSVLTEAPQTSNAKARIVTFLKTAKALRPHGFNIVRVHDTFFAEDLGDNYTPSDFLNDQTIPRDLKTLLQSIVKTPFVPNADSYEAEAFILNRFETLGKTGVVIQPEGLAVAYVHESQSISFSGAPHWEQESLEVTMTNPQGEQFNKSILNHVFETCTTNAAFLAWVESLRTAFPLNSLSNIQLAFPITQFEFEQKAIEDLISWYYDDIRYQNRIKKLMEDIEAHPFTGGLGHTEVLAGQGGRASKRIVGKDRLIYTYTDKKIIIHQCKGHYEDH
jgi:toxin YoeB